MGLPKYTGYHKDVTVMTKRGMLHQHKIHMSYFAGIVGIYMCLLSLDCWPIFTMLVELVVC